MIATCLHSLQEDYSTAHPNDAPVSQVLNKSYHISKWLLQLFDHNIIHFFVVMSTVNSAMVVNIKTFKNSELSRATHSKQMEVNDLAMYFV